MNKGRDYPYVYKGREFKKYSHSVISLSTNVKLKIHSSMELIMVRIRVDCNKFCYRPYPTEKRRFRLRGRGLCC
jgi:hypothetical protein